MSAPRPRNALQQAGDALVVEQARQGKTLQEIGDTLGVTREAVRQRLQQAGYTTRDFPRGACSYCGAPLVKTKAVTKYGLHACRAPSCLQRFNADAARQRVKARATTRLGTDDRAACAHCGRVLPWTKPRTDGRPSFCAERPCKAARVRWLYHNDPVYREYNRRSTVAGWHGRPRPTMAQVRREVGGPPPLWGRAAAPEVVARSRAILALRGTGVSEREVAREFGVSRSTVNAIWAGKRWTSLQGRGVVG